MSTFIELVRKRFALRRELKQVEQELCEHQNAHTWVPHWEWHWAGKRCTKCDKQVHEVCHTVGCTCALPHSNAKSLLP